MINTLNRQIIGTGGGGTSASIYVTGLSQTDTVTMTTPSGKTVVGVWDELPNPIAHGLPEGYTELEYIESTGSQYINTGIQAKEWARFVTDFNITTYSDNFGLFSLASGTDFKGIEFGSTSEKDAFIRYHSAIACRSSVKFTTNQWYHIDVTARVGTQSIKLDGSVVASSSASTTDDGTGIMYLFGRNYNNELNAPFKGRMATVSIYDYSDSLIHYYIPCRRNSDNKVSMYDLVSGTFLEPNGTFTGGEVIPTTIPCFRLLANEYGMHTITASNGVKTSTEEVLVDALMDYWVEMDYYTYLYRYGSDGFNSSHRFTGWNAYTRVDSVNTLTGYAVTALSNQYSLIQSDTKISVQSGQKLCVELNTSAINKSGAESRLALSSVQDYGVSSEVQVAGDLILSVGTQVQSMIVNSSGSYYVSVPIFSATTVITKIWLE